MIEDMSLQCLKGIDMHQSPMDSLSALSNHYFSCLSIDKSKIIPWRFVHIFKIFCRKNVPTECRGHQFIWSLLFSISCPWNPLLIMIVMMMMPRTCHSWSISKNSVCHVVLRSLHRLSIFLFILICPSASNMHSHFFSHFLQREFFFDVYAFKLKKRKERNDRHSNIQIISFDRADAFVCSIMNDDRLVP